MHNATKAERVLSRWIDRHAEERKREKEADILNLTGGRAYTLASCGQHDSENVWLSEVILTSLGNLLYRKDAIEVAKALRSIPLMLEAITTETQWADAEPEDLESVLVEHEILANWYDHIVDTGLVTDEPPDAHRQEAA